MARTAQAQYVPHPSGDWRSLGTAHFDFHYQRELEPWTRFVAARIEAIDSAVSLAVGNTPRARVNVVVEDPYNVANGLAIPLLDHPIIEFWATPPDPRDEVGELRTWGEMLASHEFAHVAHLGRPSRNHFQRTLWRLLPVDLGPIPLRAPRWVMEGYATYIEGRVTGTGRPYGMWRAAVLRQWAIEGRLPTYAQMSASSVFDGGSFAYLVGSAYLEWLVRRQGQGDSSLVAVWRRLTARQVRSFDEAFTGVFGDTPATLYARFTVELTTKAVAAERALASDSASGGGLVQGELVQHLAWATGDPGISPDGGRVAIVLRTQHFPSRVVVWGSAPEADTAVTRYNDRLLRRDPEDVPARRYYPPPKRPLATLRAAAGGLSYQEPRFFPDGRHILLWRDVRRSDGTFRPDLFVWDTGTGSVRRVTRGAGVRDADPAPDARTAAAIRCTAGHCDVVIVDLADGRIATVAAGDAETSYYRPRYSPDGASVAVAVHRANRWRIALVDTRGGGARVVDPDDGASRFDAAWLSPRRLVLVSNRGGIANLERLDIATASVRTLTRVTGAAVAPAPNPRDSSIWFLALHASGYDVRRLPVPAMSGRDSARAPELEAPLLDTALAPVVPRSSAVVRAFAATQTNAPRAYGFGPHVTRWFPAPFATADGAGLLLSVASVDPIGRLAATVDAVPGQPATWHGASAELVWRGWWPELRLQSYYASQSPLQRAGTGDGMVAAPAVALTGAALSASYAHESDEWTHSYAMGASLGSLVMPGSAAGSRSLAFGRFDGRYRQGADLWHLSEGLTANASTGSTGGHRYGRFTASAAVATGGQVLWPLSLSSSYGALFSEGAVDPFEQFSVGGVRPTFVDEGVLPQRIDMAALPTGTLTGARVLTGRASTFILGLNPFYWIARTASSSQWESWHRVYGLEWALSEAPLPVIAIPGVRLTFGAARSLDAPFANEIRGWAVVQLRP